MPDMTSRLLPGLISRRLEGLDTGEGFILPEYNGASILNIPDSICELLGAPGLGPGGLHPGFLPDLGGEPGTNREVQRVILVLVDALSLDRMQRWMAAGELPVWDALMRDGQLAPLTSIVPSTTAAALTTFWTGRSTAEHAIAGYELWLKEYGIVANMIVQNPISYQAGSAGSLSLAGFRPEEFLGLPTLGTHLLSHGVKTYAFQQHSLIQSGLSQMLLKDVNVQGFGNATDLWINLRQLIEVRPHERMYAWVYWGEVDHYSHIYGPDDEHPRAEFSLFSQAMDQLFLKRLSPELRRGTLLLLCADHGQTTTRKDPYYDLRNHPGLTRRLHILPTGENRLAYLYIRPGQTEAVREYIERTWAKQFLLLDPVYAVERGLFGPGNANPHLMDRLGDLIVAARGDAYLWWASKENPLVGRHGGLSPEEMLVPFISVRL
ncbi:MAG: alkaline phosphatase family protein [Omnitrophica WOR_2 bacterium]